MAGRFTIKERSGGRGEEGQGTETFVNSVL